MSEEEARDRLRHLLGYVKEIATVGCKDETVTQLPDAADGGAVVLHEAQLRRLIDAPRGSDGRPVLWLSGDGRSGVWMKFRRPDGGASNASALHRLACDVYASLFSLRQEALREGRGSQLMVGVGLVRGTIGKVTVDHPLVMLPADIEMDTDGALVVRSGDACHASLWSFPGLPSVAPAVVQMDQAAKDYGLVGTNQPPAPSDRDRWEPLLSRAAHCLASNGVYADGPPTKLKGAGYARHSGALQVHNTFTLYSAPETSGDHLVSKDADALIEALGNMPGELPAALGRLAGVYGLPVQHGHAPHDVGGGSLLLRMLSLGYLGGAAAQSSTADEFLYFGLPSNEQQDTVVDTLERQGCAVLLGPPGTGKSQTIANVICHYLATGRRVLVTSKGEPATEVLRNKLPEGIRELAISLGGGDSGSFRRLEGAVEHLADHVAGASADKLKEVADRLQNRFRSIQKQITDIEEADLKRAEKFFPPATLDASPLDSLHLHADSILLLGLRNKSDRTMVNLAEAVVATLGISGDTPPSAVTLPVKAFFLEDLTIESTAAPPAQHLLEELCSLRRSCLSALQWETELRSDAAKAPRSQDYDVRTYRELAQQMREFVLIREDIERGELPRIVDADKGEVLVGMLDGLHLALSDLEEKRKLAVAPTKATKAKGKGGTNGGSGSWLFQLLRHSDDQGARQTVQNIFLLSKRMDELSNHFVGPASQVQIIIPATALESVDTPLFNKTPEELELSADKEEGNVDSNVLGNGNNEFAAEVEWRSHPEKHGFLSEWWHQGGAQGSMLEANLAAVKFDGRTPTNPHEWEHIETCLVLRGCAARLREQWILLRALAPGSPNLPAAQTNPKGSSYPQAIAAAVALGQFVSSNYRSSLEVCVQTMDQMKGLASTAMQALGSAMEAVDAATAGPAECKVQTEKIKRSLRSLQELTSALVQRDQLHSELGNPAHESPLGALQAAIHELGSLTFSADEVTQHWHTARAHLREACLSLENVNELRSRAKSSLPASWARHVGEVRRAAPNSELLLDPCPSDARRIWAAIAAREAMRREHRSIAGTDNGNGAAAQRLLGQRMQAVEALVAAVAKHALRQSMSPEMCAGLVRLVSAVAAAGAAHGDSDRAHRYRADLTAAMNDCASAVPCWIMPCWRIAQCLPAEIASFDLVVLDEASQSDITALGALLRGKRVLVVGDQKQVSPTAAFISESRVRELKSSLLKSHHPYVEQLLPGRSIFDLAQTCFADARVSLSQHFRCVPACIAFSNEQFYHSRLQPRRLPPHSERLEPALIDVFVKNGKKQGKINAAEADAVVAYLKAELSEGAELSTRGSSVGIISLMGVEQTRVLRRKVLEGLTDSQLAKHKLVVGDPAGFQGDEKDVILLSMVASKGAAPSQVGRMYEQRFNVALSRARDRMVLFRSLNAADIVGKGDDLKLATLNFFSRASQPSGRVGSALIFDDTTVEGQLLGWLSCQGFAVDASLSVAGCACVVEDAMSDRRICVCIDGTGGSSLNEWCANLKEQRGLLRAGWSFVRLWHTNWLIDRPDVCKRMSAAFQAAGIHPDSTVAVGRTKATLSPLEVTSRGPTKSAKKSAKRANDPDEDDVDEEEQEEVEVAVKKPPGKKPKAAPKKVATPKAAPKPRKSAPKKSAELSPKTKAAKRAAPAKTKPKAAAKATKAKRQKNSKDDFVVEDDEEDDY